MAGMREMLKDMSSTLSGATTGLGAGASAALQGLAGNPYVNPREMAAIGNVSGAAMPPEEIRTQALQNLRQVSGAAISEDELRQEIERLSQGLNPEIPMGGLRGQTGAMLTEQEIGEFMRPSTGAQFTEGELNRAMMPMQRETGAVINDADVGIDLEGMMGRETGAAINEAEFSQEDRELLEKLQTRENSIQDAPLGPLVQELRQQGPEEDTELAHLRLGEFVITPEMMEDESFATVVQKKYEEEGINPEDAMVGGIANLDPNSGIQTFFLKKLAKNVKKFVKKAAPILQFIPGPIGAAASIYNKGKTIIDVAKGKANPLALLSVAGPMRTGQSFGDSFKTLTGAGGGISGLKNQITSGFSAFKDAPIDTITGLFKSQNPTDYTKLDTGEYVNKITGETISATDFGNLASRSGSGIQRLTRGLQGGLFGTEGMAGGVTQGTGAAAGSYTDAAGNVYSQQQMMDAGLVNSAGQLVSQVAGQFKPTGQQQGGGMGGLGSLAGMALAGGIAGKLGKLAYDEAKDSKGVSLSPVVAMDATGRYNLEAEMARRMGQQAPNPTEFGLLPANTFPQLSGGQRLSQAFNNEEPQEQVMAAAMGGEVMNYQDGGSAQYPNKGLESLAKVAPEAVRAMGYNMGGQAMMPMNYNMGGQAMMPMNYNMGGQAMMPMNYNMGGRAMMPMAYAEGGNVAMEDFNRMNGQINGEGTETSDDIPAMLSDGEFVMTGQAVRGAGSYKMKNDSGIVTLTPNGAPNRDSGTEMMYQLMEAFSSRTGPA